MRAITESEIVEKILMRNQTFRNSLNVDFNLLNDQEKAID